MNRFAITGRAALALLIAAGLGCSGGGEVGDVTAGQESATADREVIAMPLAAANEEPAVVDVDALFRDEAAYAGPLAVRGAVVEIFENRAAFVLVDIEEFKSCGFEACADSRMPIRLDNGAFQGALPKLGDIVSVVGEFEPLERGFRFDVTEVHRDGMVILTCPAPDGDGVG